MAEVVEKQTLPADLTAAIVREAEYDADAVCDFLDVLGFEPSHPIPGRLAVGLAAALRLLDWETAGYSVHREMRLPAAADVIRDVFERAADPDDDRQDFIIATLWAAVVGIKEVFFALESRSFFDTDVLVGELSEDALVEALALVCWANRNDGARRE